MQTVETEIVSSAAKSPPLTATVTLRLGELSLEGYSRAGTETWFRVHPPGLAFDAGRGALALAGAADLFLTHGHLDHALGVPFVLSQRSLHHASHTRVFCPAPIAEALAGFIAAAARLEGVEYRYELTGLAPGDRVPVGRDLTVEAFATDHVVASLGYHLRRRRQRLARALVGRPGHEIMALRAAGTEVSEAVEERWLSYCGDTGPGVFERSPEIFESRILMLECTFMGERHRDRGGLYGHLHLADLAVVAGRFENEDLVLHHLSRRHPVEELRAAVARELPALRPRLHLLVE